MALSATVCAETATDFYSEKARGWFWYERMPDMIEEEKPMPAPAPAPAAAVPQFPSYGSAAWIKSAMPALLEKATDEPTRENVAAYYYVQRMMKDKSEAFAEMSQQVVTADPWLDENTRRPIAQFGSDAVNRKADLLKEQAVLETAQKAGFWFFFKGDCDFCNMQSPILKYLQHKYGFHVVGISLDGTALANGDYPDFLVDHGQALKISQDMGVDMNFTPSLFLVKPPGKIVPITFGLTSGDEILQRVLMQAAAEGWIDRETYEGTKKTRKDMNIAGSSIDSSIAPDDSQAIMKAVQLQINPKRIDQ